MPLRNAPFYSIPIWSFSILLFMYSLLYGQTPAIVGADVSYLKEIEKYGGSYKQGGVQKDALLILKDLGFTHIRLRLWHSPIDGVNDLTSTLTIAKRAKSLGMKFLLDLHYSDTWADPGKQSKPAAWEALPFTALKESVYAYTVAVMHRMKGDSVYPEMVQIGNETICGMLWNEGNVCGTYNTAQQWFQYGALVKEGIRAIRETEPVSGGTSVMLHLDRGGDSAACRWFFDNIAAQQIPYDLIGLSYYPWWHGTFSGLDANIRALTDRFQKDVIVVETAYPWTLQWNDAVNNIVGLESQTMSGYPATVAGQQKFLADLSSLLRNIPNNRARGFFYWGTENISAPGLGSVWENVTLFDFSGNVLPYAGMFTDVHEESMQVRTRDAIKVQLHNHPNPFNAGTVITFTLPSSGYARLTVYDISGREIVTLADGMFGSGEYRFPLTAASLPSGIYMCVLQTSVSSVAAKLLLLR